MPNNLTDNDIVKALECCIETIGGKCHECPYQDILGCEGKLIVDTLDLINRLQAEIERLRAGADSLFNTLDYRAEQILKLEDNLKTAKAEAYREFAERLKKEIDIKPTHSQKQNDYVFFLIDNLLKELVGEDNESKD